MPAEPDLLRLLLNLATDADQIDYALTEVGGYQLYEAKAAYLAGATKSNIVHGSGGTAADDFWALAEALVRGDITLK